MLADAIATLAVFIMYGIALAKIKATAKNRAVQAKPTSAPPVPSPRTIA